MRRRFGGGLVALAVICVSLSTTLAPLHWSPYPSTLDGLGHARIAEDIRLAGTLIYEGFRADNFVPPIHLAMAAEVTGIRSVILAQPLFSLVGMVLPLFGVALVGRLAREWHWSRLQYRTAATVTGLALAVDGLLVRRIGAPDSDVYTLPMAVLVILTLFWYVRTGRRAWLGVAVLELLLFPITHTFSTLVAALSVTAIVVATLSSHTTRRTLHVAGVTVAFWGYFAAYYAYVPSLGLDVPYIDRVYGYPGLFLAWMVVLILGVRWLQSTERRSRTAVFAVPFGLFFLLFIVNGFTTVFPGTAATTDTVLLFMLPLAVPVAAAVFSAPLLGERDAVAPVLLALVAAPVVIIGFSLTAALTPEFMATAMRAQSFAHLPVFVLTGVAVGLIGRKWSVIAAFPSLRLALAVVVVLATAFTLPIAYVTLDTGAFPKGTHSSEFEAGAFAAEYVHESWTSDHKQTRVASAYFETSPTVSPTMSWLGGAPPPGCPMVAEETWTTTGAHLFPFAPRTVSPERFARTHAQRNVVYSSSGYADIYISEPTTLKQSSVTDSSC